MKKQFCSICQKPLDGYGNNAEPINNGRCCDECNDLVVRARIVRISRDREEMVKANRRKGGEKK